MNDPTSEGIDPPRMPDAHADADADADAANIDLTGIDPLNWAETRERVAILRAWCANGRHPRGEAVAAAERMGTSVTHFYRLVATWKKHRDARLVSGHSRRRGDEQGPRSITGDARAITTRVIDERGTEARFTDVRAEVRSECAAAGVAAPSSGLIHRMMMRARQSSTGAVVETPRDIAIAVVACLLPVTVDGRTVAAPDLVLAVKMHSGIIVGHSLVMDGETIGAARTLLSGLGAWQGGQIVVAAALRDAVDQHAYDFVVATDGAVRAIGFDARVRVATRSTLLSTTLGSYIDSIPIRHRAYATRAPGRWTPLSAADAVTAIDLAVAAHNAARRD